MAQSLEPDGGRSNDTILRISNISKRFGLTQAVDDVAIDIHRGEFFALLGPSGCGKTTLMRMLAGFEIPDSGKIFLDGVDITRVPPYLRPVNMMFQSYALFPHMNVIQNIAFGLKQDRLSKAVIRERVEEVLELLHLTPYVKRRPDQLSGGQKQRVALARSLVKKPKVLLLDEPLGALDKRLREHTQFELMRLQKQLGMTFIIVTHDQDEAMTMANRIGVMHGGRLVQVASPTEIYENPNSKFVAEFIGDMNLFEGRVGEINDEFVRFHSYHNSMDMFVRPMAPLSKETEKLASGNTAWLAVRPEKLQISLARPDQGPTNCLSGKVREIGYMGKYSIYHVELPNGKVVTATYPNQTRSLENPIHCNDNVHLTWEMGAGVLLLQ